MRQPLQPAPPADNPEPLSQWAKISIIYLFLPLILFIAGWVRPSLSLPVLACIAASGFTMLRSSVSLLSPSSDKTPFLRYFWIAAISIAFAILCGLIDWIPQSPDHLKHSLILGDLIERPWPVRYSSADGNRFLCYGLGHYMVPAAFGKFFGINLIGYASFAWTTLGLFLFFLWLSRRFTRRPLLGITLFLLCSGFGALWHLIKKGIFFSSHEAISTGENLLNLGLYTSNLDSFTRFLYQPQHALVAWLGGALIYELLFIRRCWTSSAAVLAASAFWSPITACGLATIGLVALIASRGKFSLRPSIHLISAVALTSILIAYFLPHVPIPQKGFIWELAGNSSWRKWYLLFLILFVAFPLSAIAFLEWKHPYLGRMKPLVVAMTIILVISPLYKMGQFSDMRMQLSGPAMLFIALALAKGLCQWPYPRITPSLSYASAVLLVGAAFPLLRTVDNLTSVNTGDYRISALRNKNLNSILDLTMPGFDVTAQYLGKSDSTSARWILKPSPVVEVKSPRH